MASGGFLYQTPCQERVFSLTQHHEARLLASTASSSAASNTPSLPPSAISRGSPSTPSSYGAGKSPTMYGLAHASTALAEAAALPSFDSDTFATTTSSVVSGVGAPPLSIMHNPTLTPSSLARIAVVGVLLGFICFGLYLILGDYLVPVLRVFLAFMWSLVTRRVHKSFMNGLKAVSDTCYRIGRKVFGQDSAVELWSLLSIGALSFLGNWSVMSFGWATIVSFSICAVILLIWTMDRALLASLSVTLAVVVLIVGMLALLSGGLYVEGKRILDSIVSYLETEQIQLLLNNHERSPIYHWLLEKFDYFGFNTSILDPVYLQSEALSLIYRLAQKGDIFLEGVRKGISFASDTFFSVVLFFTSFVYFMQYNNQVRSAIQNLSPFSASVTREVYKGMEESWLSITRAFLFVGAMNGIATFCTFYFFLGIPSLLLPILSAFLSALPIFSAWIVWVPACIYLAIEGSYWRVIAVAVIHIFTSSMESRFLSKIPHSHPYAISVSIVLGLYSIGLVGSLLAPLLLCLSAQLYAQFLRSKGISADGKSPSSPQNGGSRTLADVVMDSLMNVGRKADLLTGTPRSPQDEEVATRNRTVEFATPGSASRIRSALKNTSSLVSPMERRSSAGYSQGEGTSHPEADRDVLSKEGGRDRDTSFPAPDSPIIMSNRTSNVIVVESDEAQGARKRTRPYRKSETGVDEKDSDEEGESQSPQIAGLRSSIVAPAGQGNHPVVAPRGGGNVTQRRVHINT